MSSYRVALLLIIIFIVALAGAYFVYQNRVSEVTEEPLPTPDIIVENSPRPSPVSFNGQPPSVQPQAGFDTSSISGAGIIIETPSGGNRISSPVTVSGQANVLDGKILVLVKDASGNILGSSQAQACFGYSACPFKVSVDFTNSQSEAGTIEVYNPAVSEGTQNYLQTILVRF